MKVGWANPIKSKFDPPDKLRLYFVFTGGRGGRANNLGLTLALTLALTLTLNPSRKQHVTSISNCW